MPWTSVYNSGINSVEIVYMGIASEEDLKAEEEQSIALSIEHGTNRFLVDMTNYQKSLSLLDFIQSPVMYEEKLKRPIYVAVVDPLSQEAKEDTHFYELVCRNRGWSVKSFVGREQAIGWLVDLGPAKPYNK